MGQTDTELMIASELAELQARWYGHDHGGARCYVAEDVVVVVIEETFSPAERALIARHEVEGIQEIRRRFQQAIKDDFVAIVTHATGRQVRTFVSDTDLEQAIAVETFVLGEPLEDMTGFDEAVEGSTEER